MQKNQIGFLALVVEVNIKAEDEYVCMYVIRHSDLLDAVEYHFFFLPYTGISSKNFTHSHSDTHRLMNECF
jgi:hypothetical protein